MEIADLVFSVEGTHWGYFLIPLDERKEFIDMVLALPFHETNKLITLRVIN